MRIDGDGGVRDGMQPVGVDAICIGVAIPALILWSGHVCGRKRKQCYRGDARINRAPEGIASYLLKQVSEFYSRRLRSSYGSGHQNMLNYSIRLVIHYLLFLSCGSVSLDAYVYWSPFERSNSLS